MLCVMLGLLEAGGAHPVVALGPEEHVAHDAHLALFLLVNVHRFKIILYNTNNQLPSPRFSYSVAPHLPRAFLK
jgi:hypothetical protein